MISSSVPLMMAPFDNAMNPVIRILGTDETEINCNVPIDPSGNYTLEVDYTLARSTESYIMQSIPYAPEANFNNIADLGTEVTFSASDRFSAAIPFFLFSFFDHSTSQLVIGENGLVSMDPLQAGGINLRFPSADNPNSTLTRQSIFGAHYDLMINEDPNAGVYYKITGAFPARKMIITYRNAQVFFCDDPERTSVQIVLEELTNKIRIHIQNKKQACGVDFEAVTGIMDAYGNLGYTPPGRNYSDGSWTASNESWEFVPNGERLPVINWFEGDYTPNDPANSQIGTGETITVNSSLLDFHYVVEVRYPHYRNAEGVITDLVLHDDIWLSENYPIGRYGNVIVCDESVNLFNYNQLVSVNPATNFQFTYYFDAALTQPVPNPSNYTLTQEDITLYVKVEFQPDCYDVAELHIGSILGGLLIDPTDMELFICDDVYIGNAEGVESNYALSQLSPELFGNLSNGVVRYFSSVTATSPITQMNITDGSQIWVEVEVQGAGGCTTERVGPITIRFFDISQIENVPGELELVECDKQFNYVEPFIGVNSWADFLAENGLTTTNPATDIVRVFETLSNAENNQNALTQMTLDVSDPAYDENDNSMIRTLHIRVESEHGCVYIESLTTRIRFYGVDASDTPMMLLCVNEGVNETVDLSCFLESVDWNNDGTFEPGMFKKLYDVDGNRSFDINDLHSITFHQTQTQANAGTNPISNIQQINSNQLGTITYFVRFTLCEGCSSDDTDCYTVRRIQFNLVSSAPLVDQLEVCEDGSGQTLVSNLGAAFNNKLVNTPNQYTIRYYTTQQNAQDQVNAINSYAFTGNNYLWVHIVRNGNFANNNCISDPTSICEGIYRIHFIYGDIIEEIAVPDQIVNDYCDNNNDGEEPFDLTQFESQIYDGQATFTYFKAFNPTTYTFSQPINNPTEYLAIAENNVAEFTVYVRVQFEGNSCASYSVLNITLNFLPPIETEGAFICECLGGVGEYATFDLTSQVDNMFSANNANNGNPLSDLIVTYYNFFQDATSSQNAILNPNSYQSIRGTEDVFVRFFNPESGCYTIDTLQLRNLVLPIPIPGQYSTCDSNFNSFQDVILSDLDSVVMPQNTELYYYSYYASLDDAHNQTNPLITNPDPEDPRSYFYEFENGVHTVYVRVDADNGDCSLSSNFVCYGVNAVNLDFAEEIGIANNNFDLPPVCDTFDELGTIINPTYNDGIASGIDLTSMQSAILADVSSGVNISNVLYYASEEDIVNDPYPFGITSIQNPANYTNVDADGNPVNTVYVRLESSSDHCPIYVELDITVLDGPEIIPEDNYYVCPEGSVDIRPIVPEGYDLSRYTLIWTLPNGTEISGVYQLLNQTTLGTYSLQVIDEVTGCSSPVMNFNVVPMPPPQIHTLQVENENTVTVIASGENFPFEYSMDGINWQSSNVFSNLSHGIYTFYVRYNYNNNSCISEPRQTVLLFIANFITPNSDGKNDKVRIDNLHAFGEEMTQFQVFDRYGKLLHQEWSNDYVEWDGIFSGRVVPTTDYWYILRLPDGRMKSGHITVRNRYR
ncbi:MAG: T9SS type B sorting domain-containing protein [Weeksellaceae bacterium]|nr:T9SS type B sorting domain-containing protein [Weeksellaceae bacterium]